MNVENKNLVDVREADEYAAERVPGSIHLPLSRLPALAPDSLAGKDDVVLICRTGKRAALAAGELERLGICEPGRVRVYDGGIDAWKASGLPVEGEGARGVWPVMQQVQIVVGFLVLAASLGTLAGVPGMAWISAFFGAGLLFAGLSGYCGLALLLAKMPWNRRTS